MEISWEQFDEIFGIKDEARFAECKSLGRTTDVIEITINYPETAEYKRLGEEKAKYMTIHTFIDVINYLHERYSNVLQTNYVIEYSPKMHLHGYIEINNIGGTRYGLCEEIMRFLLTYVRPGRGRENTWERAQHYPFPCVRVPFCCVNVGPKEKSNGWEEYMKKNALELFE